MGTQNKTLACYATHLLRNYPLPKLILVKGQGSYVWDAQGRRYLDFTMGIASNTLGHCHPYWVRKVQEQAASFVHCSNIFAHENQAFLARRLVERAGPGRLFFCNSGAEANEALLKLTRLYGCRETGQEGKKYTILCAHNAFHGRTFGSMSATPQAKIQKGYSPLLKGFAFGRLNDLQSFANLIDEQTAAIFLETIQGEGGIHVAEPDFLRGIRKLCDDHGLLFLLDEVQCGLGRTGTFFAFEHSGIRPDAIAMAKGLGGGFPIGAIWVAEPYTDCFRPGSDGTTFGGSPLACAAALAVLDVIENEYLLEAVEGNSRPWIERLQKLAARFPDAVADVRGLGYLIGIALRDDPMRFAGRLCEKGLLAHIAGSNVVRFLPPLTATSEELDQGADIFEQVLYEW